MTCVQLHYLHVGQCRHLECIAARGGRWALVDFPSYCGLIRHPERGWILFDTGYAEHFFAATRPWPQRLYDLTVPVTLPVEQQLLTQLAALGVQADDIQYIVLSHYHGDHVAGLRDFPGARFMASRRDSDDIHQLANSPWRATIQGKLPALLPNDYFQRLTYVEDASTCAMPGWMQPFEQGFDLFGDGSLIAVPLPGHSPGQMGLFLPDANGRPVFMVADACWSLDACREGRLPALPARLITADFGQYRQTFQQVAELARREPGVRLLPSHCLRSWSAFQREQ